MRGFVGCIMLPWVLSAQASSAQDIVHVGGERCDSCRIEVSRELVFGDDDGPGIVEDLGSWVRRGPDGQYLVVARAGSARSVAVFDSLGRFQRRVGRQGQGPREFQDIVQVQVLAEREIAVFDRLNMRLSLWSPQFELIETRPLRVLPGYSAFYLPDGSVLTSGRQPAPDLAGRPVIQMGPAGQPAPGFNAHGDPYPATDEDNASRRLAMSGDTAFWSAHVDRYEVHLWGLDGRLLRTLRGSVDWFPDDAGEPPPGAPPPPRLVGVWEEGGVMWMLVIVPDEDWREAITPGGHSRGYRIDDDRGYRDAMLHAVDVRTGEVLGERRLDIPVFNFVDGARLSFVEEDRELVPRMVILAFDLVR